MGKDLHNKVEKRDNRKEKSNSYFIVRFKKISVVEEKVRYCQYQRL